MATSAENRKKYTYLSDMRVAKVSDDTLAIELKNRTVEIRFEVREGIVWPDMIRFENLCESDDVSLSNRERNDLLDWLENVAAEE